MDRAKKISAALLIAGGLTITGATATGLYATFKGKLNADAILSTYLLGLAPTVVGYSIRRDIENQNIRKGE